MINLIKIFIFFVTLSFFNEIYTKDFLKEAISNENRKVENIKRDKYRNPYETLNFFGIDKEMKILEIIPGRGWYTEIIAKYMKDSNNFYVAKYDPPQFAVEILTKIQDEFEKYFLNNESRFGKVKYVSINKDFDILSEKNKFDMVLTFRNSHNWLKNEKAEKMYNSISKIMKKGGVLGIVQHRANETSTFNYKAGYVKESFLIKLVEKQGFKLIDKSEVNSNPKDLKNYEKGVWTLPPTLRLGEKDRLKYLKIGESDRMTLKFIKQ